MSLDLTPVHRNLHTKVTFLGLEFEDLILVLALAALMNLLAHFVSGNAHVFGDVAGARRLRSAHRSDKRRCLLDGNDEFGKLDCQRNTPHVCLDTTCGDGAAHGRSSFRDLSGFDLDQEVHRGDCCALGLGHHAPGRVDGDASPRSWRVEP